MDGLNKLGQRDNYRIIVNSKKLRSALTFCTLPVSFVGSTFSSWSKVSLFYDSRYIVRLAKKIVNTDIARTTRKKELVAQPFWVANNIHMRKPYV
jgi:hypothetical protein